MKRPKDIEVEKQEVKDQEVKDQEVKDQEVKKIKSGVRIRRSYATGPGPELDDK